MRGVKTVLGIIVVAAVIGVLAGCPGITGPEDSNDTGSIAGAAHFSGGNNHAGILISLEAAEGDIAQSVRSVFENGSMAARSVTASITTGANGAYAFDGIAPGTYTIYASSRDSSEGAVTTNITVTAGSRAVAADLQLTPVGSLAGRIKVKGGETGNVGFLVFIAGASYMAMTNDAGNFTISGIPAGNGYEVVIMKGSYTAFWTTSQTVNGGATVTLDDKILSASDLNETGAAPEGTMIQFRRFGQPGRHDDLERVLRRSARKPPGELGVLQHR
ncbi:MAG: carboxypeptidase regulatory-like domain-containing protein [Treponema sp.]|jgi:hypothetical protein|nr:carboxypeptidase regulatory-like domain-containing protein [Treponema sp.]